MLLFIQDHVVDIGVAVLLGVVGLVFSFGVTALILIRMPPTYFLGPAPPSLVSARRPRWQRVAAHIGKNFIGVLLILLGIILSLPGVPGQGLLTIFMGILLTDFPGKRRVEQRIMKSPAVLGGANKIRARFGKPPFMSDAGHPASP